MSEISRTGDLDIGQDLQFSRRAWTVQRMSWIVALLVLIAAGVGLFGHGPISQAQESSESGDLRVEYERFARHQGRTKLDIVIDPADKQAAEVRVWVSREYFDAAKTQTIIPEPDTFESASDRVTMVFRRMPGSGPMRVTVELEIEQMGPVNAEIGLVGGSQVSLSQFLYP